MMNMSVIGIVLLMPVSRQGKEVTNSKIHSLLSFGTFFKQQEAKTLPFMSSSSVESLAKIVEKVPSVDPGKLLVMS